MEVNKKYIYRIAILNDDELIALRGGFPNKEIALCCIDPIRRLLKNFGQLDPKGTGFDVMVGVYREASNAGGYVVFGVEDESLALIIRNLYLDAKKAYVSLKREGLLEGKNALLMLNAGELSLKEFESYGIDK
jgi:hypothetical protein